MARHGLMGSALRSPANPMWVLGQAPRQAGQTAMDMMPQMAKLGDAAVDAAGPAISELGTKAAEMILPVAAKGLTDLGASAASAIPGIGPLLGGALEGAGTLASTAAPALIEMAGKVAPMAAKMGGRALATGSAMATRGLGDMMSGGPENPQAQRGQDFRTMAMMTPEMRNNPMDILGGFGKRAQPNVGAPLLPTDHESVAASGFTPWVPPTPETPPPAPAPQVARAPLEAPGVLRRGDTTGGAVSVPPPQGPGQNSPSAFSIMADSSGAQVRAMDAVERNKNGTPARHQWAPNQPDPFANSMGVQHPDGPDPFTMRGDSLDVTGDPTISSATSGASTPGGRGGGGGLLGGPQQDVINMLRRRNGSLTRPMNR